MASDVIDRYRRWFDYEQDAHDKVLASFDSAPTQRRDTPEFRTAIALFAHMVAIEQGESQAVEQLLPLVYDERAGANDRAGSVIASSPAAPPGEIRPARMDRL